MARSWASPCSCWIRLEPGLVSGSALLVSGVEHAERTAAEGSRRHARAGQPALASLSSGLIVADSGVGALGLIGLALVAAAVVAILRLRGRVSPRPVPS